MSKKAYNYDFKLYLEGVEVPFYSANIVNTPNGVEANINLYETNNLYDLKPKTMVQIFYCDWMNFNPESGKKPQWRLMFNGSISKFYKVDQDHSARGASIVCRDFRADIRKTPSNIVNTTGTLLGEADFSTIGMEGSFTTRSTTAQRTVPPSEIEMDRYENDKNNRINEIKFLSDGLAAGTMGDEERKKLAELVRNQVPEPGPKTEFVETSRVIHSGGRTHRMDAGGLSSIWYILALIAGSTIDAQNPLEMNQVNTYRRIIRNVLNIRTDDEDPSLQFGFFLDAIARGLWTESVAATRLAKHLNKRLRMDKMLFIPKNEAGTFIFNMQSGSGDPSGETQIGSVIMGHSRYASLESVIMNLAALFQMRPYSCNTPSLISIREPENKSLATQVMDSRVRNHLLKEKGFGAPYILNQGMILPPLEFTAPPNCNIMFPCMCHRVEWDYDFDVDFTRGRFHINEILRSGTPNNLGSESISIPNDVGSRVFLTEEERYKGVNLMQGSISNELISHDATSTFFHTTYGREARIRALELKNKLLEQYPDADNIPPKIQEKIDKIKKDIESIMSPSGTQGQRRRKAAYHHAKLQYFNGRYSGRVCSVEMAFNPFIMEGFPGIVIAGSNAYGKKESKNIIGMVQQVKHVIQIHPNGGDAATSLVLTHARFEDEPTDMSNSGAALYMQPTNKEDAEIMSPRDFRLKYSMYKPPAPKPTYELLTSSESNYVDINEPKIPLGYPYVKDLATITKDMSEKAITNRAFLDVIYEPNKIPRFYREVLGVPKSFMVGDWVDKDGNVRYFMYDTIQEAVKDLVEKKSSLLSDYQEAMKYIYREVVEANMFYVGILNMSRKVDGTYTNNWGLSSDDLLSKTPSVAHDSYDIDPEYYGVSEDYVEGIIYEGTKKEAEGRGLEPGDFSSIRERAPVTALIKERREEVLKYRKEAIKHAKYK